MEQEQGTREARRGNQRVSAGQGRGRGRGASHHAATYVASPQGPSTGGGDGPRGRGGRGGREGRGRGGGRGGGGGGESVTRGRVTPESEWTGKVVRIISGGQTGADRAGLEAGRLLGVPTGGTAPKDFLTEFGPDSTLRDFGLVDEGKLSYAARTRKNVDDADGTIAFRLQPGNGTDKTIGWAQLRRWEYGPYRGLSKCDGWRPVLVIDDVSDERMEEMCEKIRYWVVMNKIAIINIAGHRESTSGMGALYAAQVTKILQQALADLV